MDVLTKEQRRKNMQRIKGKNTSIEIKLCNSFYNGTLFSIMPCKDWDKLKARLEKGEKGDYWIKKITRNMERDEDVNKQLMFRGWTVLRFWGDEIKKNTDECVKVIEEAIFDISMEE